MTTTAKITEAAEMKLPALTGSEKQIAWATDIRARKLDSFDDWLKRIQANVSDDAQHRKNEIAFQAARNVLLTKVESRFWIDNRFVDRSRILVANNLQDAFKAEFERLCNEAGIKADVKAEKKPAEAKAETDDTEVKAETNDTKIATTTTNDATKLYKVFAVNRDVIQECKSKLNIIVGENIISVFMTVDCKTLKSAYNYFHKALEQAVADGALDAKIAQFGEFADDINDINFDGKDSITVSDDINDSYAYGINDNSDYGHGYYFWFWVRIDAISAEVKAEVDDTKMATTAKFEVGKTYTTPLAYDLVFVGDDNTKYTFTGGTTLTISVDETALKINGQTVAVYSAEHICSAVKNLFSCIDYLNGYNDFFFSTFDFINPKEHIDTIYYNELLDA